MKRLLTIVVITFMLAVFPHPSSAINHEPDRLILINVATNQLSFFENGRYVKTFPISTGKKATPTPHGDFKVINKYKNKKYHRKNIPGGDPTNPLGARWLGLNNKEYAIHGTSREGTIGTYESNGCIRMHNRDIQWMYERVPIHTRVIISSFYAAPELAAHQHGYRVVSWNAKTVFPEQIGVLTVTDRTQVYWQEPNGQFTRIRDSFPNETFVVYSLKREGKYYIGNNLYIIDVARASVKYTEIPRYIIVNQYKRIKGVR
ncbi:L,D-transpeptidase [Bacillus sp. 165]|uniref:L,D-transpeptidase n=1 Tax=Bacillus sp. 165 TaxID=1529117 RepID=UPI001ADC5B3D|nr:L,D-transpeptidase [Bacillus sp. 165]MBO9128827.1 L,D-transpeptidase [Bacillus sp. 165]